MAPSVYKDQGASTGHEKMYWLFINQKQLWTSGFTCQAKTKGSYHTGNNDSTSKQIAETRFQVLRLASEVILKITGLGYCNDPGRSRPSMMHSVDWAFVSLLDGQVLIGSLSVPSQIDSRIMSLYSPSFDVSGLFARIELSLYTFSTSRQPDS